MFLVFFFFSSRRRHTRLQGDWSSDVCSSDLGCTTVVSRSALRRRAPHLRPAASRPPLSPIHCPAGHRVRRPASVHVLPGKAALWRWQPLLRAEGVTWQSASCPTLHPIRPPYKEYLSPSSPPSRCGVGRCEKSSVGRR